MIKLSTPFDEAFAHWRGEVSAVGPGKAPAAAHDAIDLDRAFADWPDVGADGPDWPDEEPTKVQRPRRGDMQRGR